MNRFTKYQGEISDARPQIGGDLFGIMVLVILLGIFSLSGCQDSFMKQTTADKTSAIASLTSEVDAAGNVTATFDPNSGQTQVLKLASGAFAGSAVAIPPGSLAIPVSITVGEGETLASSSFTQQIGLTDNSVTAAGPSVSFIPSTNVQASSPLTLSLPFSVASLALTAIDTENVIVMFRAIKVNGDQTSYEMGVIPRSEMTISSDKVSFQTKQFGVFQLAKTAKKITQRMVQATIEAPVLKKEAGNPVLGAWESCRADNAGTGNIEPLTWLRANSSGYYNASQQWVSNVSLSWSGGKEPFTITRYRKIDCTGTASNGITADRRDFNDEQFLASSDHALAYIIKDSQGGVSNCQPVQVIQPRKILWSGVDYRERSATVNWLGPAQPYQVSAYTTAGCKGTPTDSTLTGNSKDFDIGSAGDPLSVKVSALNGSVTSNCLELKTVNSLISGGGTPVGETIVQVNSVMISKSPLPGGASQIAINFKALLTGTYETSKFSQINCPDGEASSPLRTEISGNSGSVTDVVNPSEQASYRILNSLTQTSRCINFLTLNNKSSVFGLENVSSGPTGINFSWDAGSIYSGLVKLSQHQDFGCTQDGVDVTPASSGYGYVQKVGGLQKGSSYSFKLATTDNSATALCLDARTTDGDPPFMMPDSETTLKFSAATAVNDGKTYRLLLSLDGRQIETASKPFAKSNNSAAILLVEANGQELLNKSMMLLAPNGCQFILGAKKFMNFSINESNTVYEAGTNGGTATATVTTGDLKVECNSGGNQQEGGDVDVLGSVPGRTYSRLNKLKIGKDAYIMRQDVFASKNCTGFPVSSNTEQGVFALPAIDLEGTIPIDVTQKDLDGAIFTQEGVDIANKRPLEFGCGLSGWVKGVVRKLSDSKKCGEVGRTYYERLKVDGDRLYMCSSGQNKDYGSTPDMRVPSCDMTSDMEYFTRQK